MNSALLFLQIGAIVEALLRRELRLRGISLSLECARLLMLLRLGADIGEPRNSRHGLPVDVQITLLATAAQDVAGRDVPKRTHQSGRHQASLRTEGHVRNLLAVMGRLSEEGLKTWHMGEAQPPGTPGWLTRSTGLARPAVSAALAKLLATGSVRSMPAEPNVETSKRDRRMRVYCLTESGEHQAVQCAAVFSSVAAALSKLLGREGMKAIFRLDDLLTASPIPDVSSALMLDVLARQSRSLSARRTTSALTSKRQRG